MSDTPYLHPTVSVKPGAHLSVGRAVRAVATMQFEANASIPDFNMLTVTMLTYMKLSNHTPLPVCAHVCAEFVEFIRSPMPKKSYNSKAWVTFTSSEKD